MSLRTKMMLSIFVFMGLVLGLLTLNLYLDAATRTRAEARRYSDLMIRTARDWLRGAAPASSPWTPADWDGLAEKLRRSELVKEWAFVGMREGRLEVLLTNDADPRKVLREEAARFAPVFETQRVEVDGNRVYVPVAGVGKPTAARLEFEGPEAPVHSIAEALKGILTIMAIGTALLLLNAYVFTNRFVLRPLGALVEASNRVAAGDFSKKIPESQTYDEMGRMIRAFNLMIERIAGAQRALHEDIRQARGRIHETERQLFAAQRLSTTGTLAAGIAHEINNPLGGMINAARSIKDGRLDRAKEAEYVDLILDGLERVRAIVQKILQFRPRPFQPQPVQLRESVEQAVAFLHHRLRAKEVAVRNELPEDLPRVNGDPLEIQQAFLNVLMNAVDACVMGEGVITVTHRRSEDSVSIGVADNGCGMTPEEAGRCLDPFFTTKDVGEGTGLGLAVAHNIVTNHGGRIEVSSERGKGATFTLTFPLPRARVSATTRTQVQA